MDLEIKQYQPDEFDRNCGRVSDAIAHVGSIDEKIQILEQMLDYLRMEKANG